MTTMPRGYEWRIEVEAETLLRDIYPLLLRPNTITAEERDAILARIRTLVGGFEALTKKR